MMQLFDVIQPDGMRIDLVDGHLVVVVILDGRENVSLKLPEKPIFYTAHVNPKAFHGSGPYSAMLIHV